MNKSVNKTDGVEEMASKNLNGSDCREILDSSFLVVFAVQALVIFFGNLLTCIVFLSKRQLRQTYMNVFLVNLAIADLLVSVIVFPGYTVFCTTCPPVRLDTSQTVCHFMDGAKDYILLATIFSILAITFDRYVAVMQPLRYRLKVTKKTVIVVLILTWTVPAPFSSIKQILNAFNPGILRQKDHIYDNIVVFSCIILPMFVIAIVNTMITKAIRGHVAKISFQSKRAFQDESHYHGNQINNTNSQEGFQGDSSFKNDPILERDKSFQNDLCFKDHASCLEDLAIKGDINCQSACSNHRFQGDLTCQGTSSSCQGDVACQGAETNFHGDLGFSSSNSYNDEEDHRKGVHSEEGQTTERSRYDNPERLSVINYEKRGDYDSSHSQSAVGKRKQENFVQEIKKNDSLNNKMDVLHIDDIVECSIHPTPSESDLSPSDVISLSRDKHNVISLSRDRRMSRDEKNTLCDVITLPREHRVSRDIICLSHASLDTSHDTNSLNDYLFSDSTKGFHLNKHPNNNIIDVCGNRLSIHDKQQIKQNEITKEVDTYNLDQHSNDNPTAEDRNRCINKDKIEIKEKKLEEKITETNNCELGGHSMHNDAAGIGSDQPTVKDIYRNEVEENENGKSKREIKTFKLIKKKTKQKYDLTSTGIVNKAFKLSKEKNEDCTDWTRDQEDANRALSISKRSRTVSLSLKERGGNQRGSNKDSVFSNGLTTNSRIKKDRSGCREEANKASVITKRLRKISRDLRERNGTRSCLVIVLIFIACWIPRCLLNMFNLFALSGLIDVYMLEKMSLLFLFFQSLTNPLVYSLYRNDFRYATRDLLRKMLR